MRKREPSEDSRITDRGEAIRAFLGQKLPPGKTNQADYVADALVKAGARYDRYAAEGNRGKWLEYAARRNRFKKITESVVTLLSEISELDLLSRDDLSTRVDPNTVEALLGSLLIVGKATGELAATAQKSGRPRDLAEERWIWELADIYENAFSQPARVWGAVGGRMGDFYRLLELSRPETFPRHGKLSRRQIDRILSQRRLKQGTAVVRKPASHKQER